MPVYRPDHVEYPIVGGHIQIVMDDGQQLPAYWSHPDLGGLFPGIALLHDWWGITVTERSLAHQFAQAGFYVVMPDLYDGRVAVSPQEAMAFVEHLGAGGTPRVDAALQALEAHHRCNRRVAAVGLGMGGTLALEAALERSDLEAAVAFYGFPQRLFGRFDDAKVPILAVYGSDEPYVSAEVRERLRAELDESPRPHEVMILDGAGRDFFVSNASLDQQHFGQLAWQHMLAFLDQHLGRRAVESEEQSVM
jgi:carboxymethylenebutenolidase